MSKKFMRALALAAVASLGLAACGSSGSAPLWSGGPPHSASGKIASLRSAHSSRQDLRSSSHPALPQRARCGPDPQHIPEHNQPAVRVVPRVEREEFLNAGVVVFCRPLRFLGAKTELDAALLAALAPHCEPDAVREQLAAIERIAAGDTAGGAIAALPISERFHWLVAPASTIVQPGPVHTGLTSDPGAELAHLFAKLVMR